MNSENRELKFVQIEATGFQDLCNRIKELEEENLILKENNEALQSKLNRTRRILDGVKINNGRLTLERNELITELNTIKRMGMFEFGNTYCSVEQQEADGKAFARNLLGQPMTEADIAEEKAIADGERFYYEQQTALYGDDF